jgi:hypothetical protein
LVSFFKQSSKKDGLSPRCKTCIKYAVRKYNLTDRGKEVARKSQARYRKTEHCRKYKNEWMKNAYHHRSGYKEKMINRNKQRLAEFRKTHPRLNLKTFDSPIYKKRKIRFSAIDAVKYAVRIGIIPRATTQKCFKCNKNANQYHHYLGYEKENWLKVIPVCKKCHTKIHWK